jgi:hypothetical protein
MVGSIDLAAEEYSKNLSVFWDIFLQLSGNRKCCSILSFHSIFTKRADVAGYSL